GGVVQDEVGVLPPRGEQTLLETGAAHPLQPDGRDDLVGVHVAAPQRYGPAGVCGERFHQLSYAFGRYGKAGRRRARGGAPDRHSRSAGAVSRPVTAVAAATAGETRWVRPPLPCRPSKLRLEVEAQRSPGLRVSGFMPRHMEQPAVRHSAPAALKISSRPSASAARRTSIDPGTMSVRVTTLRPRRISAAARRSSIRPLVQDPTKTVSILISRSGVPGVSPMYCRARSAAARSIGSSKSSGEGTTESSGAP